MICHGLNKRLSKLLDYRDTCQVFGLLDDTLHRRYRTLRGPWNQWCVLDYHVVDILSNKYILSRWYLEWLDTQSPEDVRDDGPQACVLFESLTDFETL